MIAVVDYGVGNLRSVANALAAIGCPARITGDAADLRAAAAIVLPGVGAFGDGIRNLRERGLVEPLAEEVLGRGKPFLGICLGLQLLARASVEFGPHDGLGWIDAEVREIVPEAEGFKVPHMGWNDVRVLRETPLFAGLGDAPVFYFVHGYHVVVSDASAGVVGSTCWHGLDMVASVQRGNVLGVQFHPEKSQTAGLALLRNFAALI